MEFWYTLIKHSHVWCVTLSFALFVVRAIWLTANSPRLNSPFFKIAPHVVDTALLLTGISLVVVTGYYHAFPAWLLIKFAAILLYICFGLVAFKVDAFRRPALLIALACFFTAAYLAINKAPL